MTDTAALAVAVSWRKKRNTELLEILYGIQANYR